ncbi:MAG: transketolase [Gomphosphaeria aponina SAG 52.96 = DSM 107014]|uniref:Transketolase n=1 Tax=Gomphosphaeria aponina SAG 52.96 = DSM 107014 TaxID=1521640 RepID=A0A941JMI7_9CHRO|nr:transketolase [Gomphosphaeria aponina SAG 52.96 = DSM 107014]
MTELFYIPKQEFERLKELNLTPENYTNIFATCCRINTLYMIAKAGSGHIGSSFSSLDIVSWLFLQELNLPDDIYYSSKGHDVPGLYAVLIAIGLLEFDLIHKLRRLDGLPGHPDISTPYIVTNTGSLGMGISKAKGMVKAQRLKGKNSQIYVLTGDGELQEGQFWESLQSAANQNLHEITAIVDYNKIQSDTWVAKVSDLGDLERKFTAFGWYVSRCNGNDIYAFSQVMAELKTITNQPKIVIADTIKGKGVSFMEKMEENQRLYKFHSGAPDEEIYTKAVRELIATVNNLLAQVGAEKLTLEKVIYTKPQPPARVEKLIPVYSEALLKEARNHSQLVALDADLALDCGLIPFEEQFPERFVECGIAEQDMVSMAGGMALKGLLPVVHSFACFLSSRPNEQIYNNATERTKIIYVGSLAGLLPAGPGHSHQCVRDISALGGVPGLIMLEPSCAAEVALALDYCVNGTSQSSYLRLVSIPCQIPYELPRDYKLILGQGVTLVEGEDTILFSYGPVMLPQAYQAAKILGEKYNISLKVVNLPWLNYVDLNWLGAVTQGFTWVFTLDNHYISGGQGEKIASGLAQLGGKVKVKQFGVGDIPKCGQNDEVLQVHRLDAASLVEDIAKVMVG